MAQAESLVMKRMALSAVAALPLRGGGNGILASGGLEKSPAFFLLTLVNHLCGVLPAVFAGRVLESVGENREDDPVGPLLLRQIPDPPAEVPDRLPDRIGYSVEINPHLSPQEPGFSK